MPKWAVIAAIVAFLALGVMWTSHHRAERTKTEPNLLDVINNRQVEQQMRLQKRFREEQANIERHTAEPATRAVQRADPEEAVFRQTLENCSFFQEEIIAAIPMSFERREYMSMRSKYPALDIAEREHLIEFDPPVNGPPKQPTNDFEVPQPDVIQVKIVPYAYSKLDIRFSGQTYQLVAGKRRIDAISVWRRHDENSVAVGFSWTYEHPVGAVLVGDRASRNVTASMSRSDSGWVVTDADWLRCR